MDSNHESENALFICQNPTCRKSFEVTKPPSQASGKRVLCSCGSEAKKIYKAPTVRKVSKAQ